ncbi:MAG: yknY [Gammaproteobacteria bacterium]|nr:yknY [Gammaproteobacteria bacterium]
MSIIDLQNITKSYRTGFSEFCALKGINLQLERRDMLAIIGSSGSGKSTLMNIMGLLDYCSTGNYFLLGEDVSRLAEKKLAVTRNKKMGFVFQSFFLLPRLNVLQNVMLPLFYREESLTLSHQKALEILKKVGMEKFIDHKPNQLSGGQQQRVAIARALVGDPEVIFADEPTGSLDSKTGREIMDLFLKLNHDEGRTIVVVTHDKEVSHLCKRVITLKDGLIVCD